MRIFPRVLVMHILAPAKRAIFCANFQLFDDPGNCQSPCEDELQRKMSEKFHCPTKEFLFQG